MYKITWTDSRENQQCDTLGEVRGIAAKIGNDGAVVEMTSDTAGSIIYYDKVIAHIVYYKHKVVDSKHIASILKKDSLAELVSLLADPCDGCEVDQNTKPCPKDCGYYEQDGLKIGKQHAMIELRRRKEIIDRALKS